MKDVRYDSITSQARQPYEDRTHEWYNSMTQEAILGIMRSLVPASYYTGKLVILSGGVVSIAGSDYTVTSGFAFYNGELYRIVGDTVTITGPAVAVWSILEENDSVTFSDGSIHPVHRDKTIILESGTTGVGSGIANHTYLFDYGDTDVSYVLEGFAGKSNLESKTAYVEIGTWNMDTTASVTVDFTPFITGSINILSIDAIIFRDNGDAYKLERIDNSTFVNDGAIGPLISSSKDITLYRKTGGLFDGADYTAAGNRGYVAITYIA